MDNKKFVNKVYCERCNVVFSSRSEFEKHLDKHTGKVECESCPLDIVIQKFTSLFKRNN